MAVIYPWCTIVCVADPLHLNTDLTRRFLSAFIHNEVTKVGFERVVLGLSGGIDSALAGYLAVEALGLKGVVAISLPYKTSSPESQAHAQLVADALGIPLEVLDISPMVDGYFAANGDLTPHRRGNVMARCRMIVLYDHSARLNGLVLGTSNKTELLLGYGTQHGDLASALNPIGDLYKTQVRQLSRAMGVAREVLDKAPSADLAPGQTDEGDLGFTYEEVDRLLLEMIDFRRSDAELVSMGFDRDFVAKVRLKVKANHFKRKPPIIAKVSARTVDKDFHYLRDWGA